MNSHAHFSSLLRVSSTILSVTRFFVPFLFLETDHEKRSQYRRPAEAPGAEAIGGVHVVFVTVLILFIIISDIPRLYHDVKDIMVASIRSRLKGASHFLRVNTQKT